MDLNTLWLVKNSLAYVWNYTAADRQRAGPTPLLYDSLQDALQLAMAAAKVFAGAGPEAATLAVLQLRFATALAQLIVDKVRRFVIHGFAMHLLIPLAGRHVSGCRFHKGARGDRRPSQGPCGTV
jgi:hypothetical protein